MTDIDQSLLQFIDVMNFRFVDPATTVAILLGIELHLPNACEIKIDFIK